MKTLFVTMLVLFAVALLLLGLSAPAHAQEPASGTRRYTDTHLMQFDPVSELEGFDQLARSSAGATGQELQAASTTAPTYTWQIECVDCPRQFRMSGDRALRLNAQDEPRLAYGGDHLYYGWWEDGAWQNEIVDAADGAGWTTNLALDSADHPHIAYYDYANQDLKYASKIGDAWVLQTVDSADSVGLYAAIDLDSGGAPHISYYDATNGELKVARWTGATWEIESVDTEGDVGLYTSLAIDGIGRTHVCYYDITNGDLKYARRHGGAWDIQTVDSNGYVGAYCSLALDTANNPHISYHDLANRDLKYARWTGSAWAIQTVASSGDVGRWTSIALDADEHPHIVHREFSGDAYLRYVYWTGSLWRSLPAGISAGIDSYPSLVLDNNDVPWVGYRETFALRYIGNPISLPDRTTWSVWQVDSSGDVGRFTSIDLDSQERPHIGYQDSRIEALKYATFSTGWQTTIVDNSGYKGSFASLALDSADQPHISHYWAFPSFSCGPQLIYAHFDGTQWLSNTIPSGICSGSFNSIAIDSDDLPHIAHADVVSPSLYYSHKADADTWTGVGVSAPNKGGYYTSLALDSNDTPHISDTQYRQDLVYWTLSGGVWVSHTVDFGSNMQWTSIAVDKDNHPHISYSDKQHGGLKYAHWTGSEWITETVDSSFNAGWYSSLALDSMDRPHIAYYDSFPGTFKYAQWTGSAWDIQVIDSANRVGWYCSLALDKDDNAHVSYYDGVFRRLKYAIRVLLVAPTSISVEGPSSGIVGTSYTFTATAVPPTSTQPLTFIWQVSGQTPVTHTGGVTNAAAFIWSTPGVYTIDVTGSNAAGVAIGSHTITVAPVCYTLTSTHNGNGADPVEAPANSPGCPVGQYVAGEPIELTAAPSTGWQVGGWSGTADDASTNATNALTMPASNHTVGVIYSQTPPTCYILTTTHTGNGSDPAATPANSAGCPIGQYVAGASISLAATPAADWQVSGWSGTGNDGSTSTANSLTMPAGNHTVSVAYSQTAPTCYTLATTHTGNGSDPVATPADSVGCAAGQYVAGTDVDLAAIPDAGWYVGGWTGTANDANTSTSNSLTMPAANHTVGVIYSQTPPTCYILTMAHTGNGSNPVATPNNSPGCSMGQYVAGEAISLAATPAAGWYVGGWTGTANDASASAANSLTMPASNHTVGVTYSQTPPTCYILTTTHTGNGASPAPTPASSPGCPVGQYVAGEAITFTAAPSTGWQVSGWSGTSNDASAGATNSLAMPAGNHSIGVTYTPQTSDATKIFLPVIQR